MRGLVLTFLCALICLISANDRMDIFFSNIYDNVHHPLYESSDSTTDVTSGINFKIHVTAATAAKWAKDNFGSAFFRYHATERFIPIRPDSALSWCYIPDTKSPVTFVSSSMHYDKENGGGSLYEILLRIPDLGKDLDILIHCARGVWTPTDISPANSVYKVTMNGVDVTQKDQINPKYKYKYAAATFHASKKATIGATVPSTFTFTVSRDLKIDKPTIGLVYSFYNTPSHKYVTAVKNCKINDKDIAKTFVMIQDHLNILDVEFEVTPADIRDKTFTVKCDVTFGASFNAHLTGDDIKYDGVLVYASLTVDDKPTHISYKPVEMNSNAVITVPAQTTLFTFGFKSQRVTSAFYDIMKMKDIVDFVEHLVTLNSDVKVNPRVKTHVLSNYIAPVPINGNHDVYQVDFRVAIELKDNSPNTVKELVNAIRGDNDSKVAALFTQFQVSTGIDLKQYPGDFIANSVAINSLCIDGLRDNGEPDIDGSNGTNGCGLGLQRKMCKVNSDCLYNSCEGGVCAI